ncbi:hypothetical protein FA13DRAFT_1736451 [Coprinellus micaceus]|uniref:DUF6533 domain-containing protein n=1 Tax=Coprinellus micaceus TaxID=71717 RepID=A0A4Y7SHC5_COPMI|nr:hypothetical protein FA13DRAFT_1742340 [Coprinellus micaceus]TEB27599.1 hypothetical protein FA13DRAFT_1736451 [Coprinellus micaceus]
MADVSLSPEELAGLATYVSTSRNQQLIAVSFYTISVYYTLLTFDEEVAIILPQKWNRGKMLFNTIRYGAAVFVLLGIISDTRNFFVIPALGCKTLIILTDIVFRLTILACDIAFGLCLAALLQVEHKVVFTLILLCSTGNTILATVLVLIIDIENPAIPISREELEWFGLPCYPTPRPNPHEAYILHVRTYLSFGLTTVLLILAISSLVLRYTKKTGGLIEIISRDGGIYYLLVTAARFVGAVMTTPVVREAIDGSPAIFLIAAVQYAIVPILAQRLMINMRKVDYLGSEPIASTLLFAPPGPSERSEDSIEDGAMDDPVQVSQEHTSRETTGRVSPAEGRNVCTNSDV